MVKHTSSDTLASIFLCKWWTSCYEAIVTAFRGVDMLFVRVCHLGLLFQQLFVSLKQFEQTKRQNVRTNLSDERVGGIQSARNYSQGS